MTVTTAVLDLGNVLIGWDPHRLFSQLIDDPGDRQRFLATVCTPEWHDRQDRGGSCAAATAELVAAHPDQAALIEAFYGRWWDMFAPMPASVDVVRELHGAGIRLLALTNWPREMFADARSRYPFLELFEGIVVSGEEGLAKPDEAIFQRLIDRYEVTPRDAVYVDDNPRHVATAARLGFSAYQFLDVSTMRRDLAGAGLPVEASVEIRPAEIGDLPALTAIYNHHVTMSAATFDLDTWPVPQRRLWFDHYAPIGRHRLFVAAVAGEVVGYASSSAYRDRRAYDPTVEVTVYLAADAGRRGIGSMLYQQLFATLASEDVHRAVAAVALPNDASLALHHRFGFVDAGTLTEIGRKFDRWWDVRYLERTMP